MAASEEQTSAPSRVSDLLRLFLAAQADRVRLYSEWERAFAATLPPGSAGGAGDSALAAPWRLPAGEAAGPTQRQVGAPAEGAGPRDASAAAEAAFCECCARVAADFNECSRKARAVEAQLRSPAVARPHLAEAVRRVQQEEREKLRLTALLQVLRKAQHPSQGTPAAPSLAASAPPGVAPVPQQPPPATRPAHTPDGPGPSLAAYASPVSFSSSCNGHAPPSASASPPTDDDVLQQAFSAPPPPAPPPAGMPFASAVEILRRRQQQGPEHAAPPATSAPAAAAEDGSGAAPGAPGARGSAGGAGSAALRQAVAAAAQGDGEAAEAEVRGQLAAAVAAINEALEEVQGELADLAFEEE